MGDFAQVVVQPADHDDGEAPAGFDPLRSRARGSRAMPLGNRNHLRDREADGRGRRDALGNAVFEHVEARRGRRQLDRDVRRPGMEAFRHRGHAGAVAGAERIHLRADESRGAPARLEARLQLVGGAQDGNPDQRFGLRLARQIRSEGAADLGAPGLAIPGQRRAHEHGVRRHADGAAGQAEIELGCVSRVVPPLRRRLTDQPLEIGAHTFMSIVNFQPPRLRAPESTRATARPRQSSSVATEPTSGGGQLPRRLTRTRRAARGAIFGGNDLRPDVVDALLS